MCVDMLGLLRMFLYQEIYAGTDLWRTIVSEILLVLTAIPLSGEQCILQLTERTLSCVERHAGWNSPFQRYNSDMSCLNTNDEYDVPRDIKRILPLFPLAARFGYALGIYVGVVICMFASIDWICPYKSNLSRYLLTKVRDKLPSLCSPQNSQHVCGIISTIKQYNTKI